MTRTLGMIAALRQIFLGVLAAPSIGCFRPYEAAECKTRLATLLYSENDPSLPEFDCVQFGEATERALDAYQANVIGWSRPLTDSWAKGLRILVHPEAAPDGSWPSGYLLDGVWHEGRIAGQSYCDEHRVEIGSTDWAISAYAHEMAHILDNCTTPNHEGWATNGYQAAIDATRATWGTK